MPRDRTSEIVEVGMTSALPVPIQIAVMTLHVRDLFRKAAPTVTILAPYGTPADVLGETAYAAGANTTRIGVGANWVITVEDDTAAVDLICYPNHNIEGETDL